MNGKRWTAAEADYLRDHYRTLGAKACAEALGMSLERVHMKAAREGLAMRNYRFWRPSEARIVQEHYASRGARFCADVLHRSIGSVRYYARIHGLRRAENVDNPR